LIARPRYHREAVVERHDIARLVLATDNPGKLEELRTLLEALEVDTASARELGFALPDETGTSYLENASIKAVAAARALGRLALGDDTGLAVPSLGGVPGVDTAGFAVAFGGWTQACAELAERTGVRADPGMHVRATLTCALVLARPSGAIDHAVAAIDGRLRWPPGDAPGLAAIFAPDPPWDLLERGVLVHRRVAYARLLPALRAALTTGGR
jgi:XTP/dITP diphosphohydrolase